MQSIHSVHYTLSTILRYLEEGEAYEQQKMTISELLQAWQYDEELKQNIRHWHTLEAQPAQYADFPDNLHPSIKKALHARGINQLYTHQREAFDFAMQGQSFTAITPTASGKSYCYHLPVLQTILHNKSARAIYLFPTKALAQDQKSDLNELIELMEEDILSYTYDGDTAPGIRQKIPEGRAYRYDESRYVAFGHLTASYEVGRAFRKLTIYYY